MVKRTAADEPLALVEARPQEVSDLLSIVWDSEASANADDVLDAAQQADLAVDEIVQDGRRLVWLDQLDTSRPAG